MKKLLLSLGVAALAFGASAQVADGQYCIKHVEEGTYLNNGFTWGTLGVIKPETRVFEVINKEDGTCLIKSSHGYIKGGNINGEPFLDGNESEAGAFNIVKEGEHYYIKTGDAYFARNERRDYQDPTSWDYDKASHEDIVWIIKYVAKEEAELWDIISIEDMKKNLENATPENPLDATFFLKAHSITRNDSENVTAWPWTKDGQPAEILVPDPDWIYGSEHNWAHQDTYAFCMNDKDSTAVDSEDIVMQEVEGVTPGTYDVLYRVVNQDNTEFELNINGTVCPVVEFTELDLWYNTAATALKTGRTHDTDESVSGEKTQEITVGEDGKLTIKMTKQSKVGQQNRFAFKSFKLHYKGAASSSVADVVVEDLNAPVEYYNLQGIRVANPENGIFIRRQGNKATKVVL